MTISLASCTIHSHVVAGIQPRKPGGWGNTLAPPTHITSHQSSRPAPLHLSQSHHSFNLASTPPRTSPCDASSFSSSFFYTP